MCIFHNCFTYECPKMRNKATTNAPASVTLVGHLQPYCRSIQDTI